jgi:DNA-binding transcriptional LysR family regulator
MNLSHVRYFLAVAETGSFSKGAERVYVSQPTLSAAVKKLESDLGARLFDRGGRRVALTAAGHRFVDRARAILDEVNAARAELRPEAGRARLRLAALRTLPAPALGRLVADFRNAEGEVALELRDGSVAEIEGWLARGRVDAALTVLAPGAKRRGAAPLFRSHLVLAVAAEDGLARRARVALAELHQRPFVVRSHCEFLAQSQRLFEAHGVRPRIAYRCDQDERALALVAAGLGLALIPDRLGGPGLAYLSVPELDLRHTIGLRWRAGERQGAVESFRAFALSHDWSRTTPSRLAWAH